MRLLRNISIPVNREIDLPKYICQKLNIRQSELISCEMRKRSLDARKPNRLLWQCTAEIVLKNERLIHPDLLEIKQKKPYLFPVKKLSNKNPFIIGAGPAGLFCALELVKKGLQPWIFDRGEKIENRERTVRKFWQQGELSANSNIQFGEGGAGTYSDGKLTARNQDHYTQLVYQHLINFGADDDIFVNAHPHLGTDKLKTIITGMRKYLEDKGCRFFWGKQLDGITIRDNKVQSVSIDQENYHPEVVILTVGNAARDVFSMLVKQIPVAAKPVAVGFRIEHHQEFINKTFYGDKTDISLTGPAEYRIKAKAGKSSVFSFCMCPGGIVVNASSHQGYLVTNGMSWSQRKGKFANSALVTSIAPQSNNPLAIMKFQEEIERKCCLISDNYAAPGQMGMDFILGNKTQKMPRTTFLPGAVSYDLNDIYPTQITTAIKTALAYWNKRYHGFAEKGLLLAPETRTSSPVRILRDKQYWHSPGAENLYPAGEGSGYSSGIISSAADGVKLAAIFEY